MGYLVVSKDDEGKAHVEAWCADLLQAEKLADEMAYAGRTQTVIVKAVGCFEVMEIKDSHDIGWWMIDWRGSTFFAKMPEEFA